MNLALTSRGASRHPVGLSVVIGAHVLLAALLATARIDRSAPAAPGPVAIVPGTPEPPKRVEAPLPKPDTAQPRQPVLQVPVIPDTPADDAAIVARPLDPDAREPVAAERPVAVARAEPAMRVQPRPASINAGASQCRPEYPAQAARAGVTGTSRIRFSVDAAGRVAAAQVLGSSGPTREHRLLDKAAADALAQCPIAVGTDDMGRPVGTTVDVEYVWRLD
jgi:protein TonB